MTPRRTTYLNPKGEGDRSMLLKRGVPEDVDGTAPQRLRARAKAELPEPQCPGAEPSRSSVARLYTDAIESHRLNVALVVRLARWPMASEAIQGHEWGAYGALETFLGDGTWDGLRGASPKATESQ